jgi:hypothetical protein
VIHALKDSVVNKVLAILVEICIIDADQMKVFFLLTFKGKD